MPLLPVLFTLLTLHAAPPAADAVSEVLTLERAACAAMGQNDTLALDSLLTDDLTLVLSDGSIERKADLIREARDQVIRYTRFENVDMVVRLYGADAAVVTGRTVIDGVAKDGSPVHVDVIFTDTVVKEHGHWKWAAGQVVRVPRRS